MKRIDVTFTDGPLKGETRSVLPVRYYEFPTEDPEELNVPFDELARRALNDEPITRFLRHQYENTPEGYVYRGFTRPDYARHL